MPSVQITDAISAWLDARASLDAAKDEAHRHWQLQRDAERRLLKIESTLRRLTGVGYDPDLEPSKCYAIQDRRAIICVGTSYVSLTEIEP